MTYYFNTSVNSVKGDLIFGLFVEIFLSLFSNFVLTLFSFDKKSFCGWVYFFFPFRLNCAFSNFKYPSIFFCLFGAGS